MFRWGDLYNSTIQLLYIQVCDTSYLIIIHYIQLKHFQTCFYGLERGAMANDDIQVIIDNCILHLVPVGTSVVCAAPCRSLPAGRASPRRRSSQREPTAPSDHTSVSWSCWWTAHRHKQHWISRWLKLFILCLHLNNKYHCKNIIILLYCGLLHGKKTQYICFNIYLYLTDINKYWCNAWL